MTKLILSSKKFIDDPWIILCIQLLLEYPKSPLLRCQIQIEMCISFCITVWR